MWIPSHVNIKGNDEVDEAAKKGTTKTEIENINIPPEDLKSIIKNHIKKEWSNSWYQKTNNKLRDIKDETKRWKVPEERKLQIVISRLRIGHTKFTHEHILKKTEPKICDTCSTTMSVKHIIEECTKYTTYRLKHKIPTTLKDALGNNNNNIYNIIKFLAEIDLLKQI